MLYEVITQQGQDYIDRVCAMIQTVLEENDIKGRVKGRVKHIRNNFV